MPFRKTGGAGLTPDFASEPCSFDSSACNSVVSFGSTLANGAGQPELQTGEKQSARESTVSRQSRASMPALRWADDPDDRDGASEGREKRLTFRSWVSRFSRPSNVLSTPNPSHVVRQYTSFEDSSLLRAGKLVDVLRQHGYIFRNAEGSASTYELSYGVREIDSFISHNWSTTRFLKFSALSIHFNFNYAALMTAVALGLYVPLACLGLLPELKMSGSHPIGVTCRVIGTTVFLFTAYSWHEFARLFGWLSPTVFLDKMCIHQTDAEQKKKGVQSLAAFLCKSKCLVIIYADTYLRKLWTVYELATFLTMHPTRPIVILSPALFKMFFLGSVVSFFRELSKAYVNMTYYYKYAEGDQSDQHAARTLGTTHSLLLLWVLDSLPSSLLLCWFLRRLGRKHADMYTAAREFQIQTAMCFDESDRPLVHKNITAFMKHVGFVPSEASQGEALDAFNELVHREMPRRMEYYMGLTGIPYVYIAAMNLPSACNCLDKVLYNIRSNGAGNSSLFAIVLEKLSLAFAIIPLLTSVFAVLSKHCQRLRGSSDLAFVFFVGTLYAVSNVIVGYGQTMVRRSITDKEGSSAELLYAVFNVSLLVWALLAYRPGNKAFSAFTPRECCDEELDGPDGEHSGMSQISLQQAQLLREISLQTLVHGNGNASVSSVPPVSVELARSSASAALLT